MNDGAPPSESERFDYFMIRLHRTTSEPERLSGQVERLGTGERWRFDTGEQLVRLVGAEAAPLNPEGVKEENLVGPQTTGSALEDGP